MHQQSRQPPKQPPNISPAVNPARTNRPREAPGATNRLRSDSEAIDQERQPAPGGITGDAVDQTGPTKDSTRKLDQIIQNFHYKVAVLVLQSRMNTTTTGGRRPDNRKPNKWFQIETDDIDDFREELRIWRSCGSFENQPPPMIIETYLDASRLSSSQSLVVLDANGKRWDALEALNSSESSGESSPGRLQRRNTEIVLERWRLELRCLPNDDMDDFGPHLPTIYKRSIVFFRSLFVMARVMPCWKFAQHTLLKGGHPALVVKCRFRTAEPEYTTYDALRQPLLDGRDVVTEYMFGDLEVPVGRLYASVTYRNDCNFRVDDSESLLSSRFMGVDEHFFKPSIPIQPRREAGRTDSFAEVGSLPSHRRGLGAQDPKQTYGSLSTFHGAGAFGTSPISALKSVRPVGSDTDSPPGSVHGSIERDPPHSLPIRAHSTAARLSFQPFKAGSLSGSPRITDSDVPPSPLSGARPSGLGGPRNRSSLTAGMAASLRGMPCPAPAAPEPSPVPGSPKPTSRYSSSFTHRRSRPSFGGQSKVGDDDQVSSGKQSLSSSAQPGSGLLAEAGGGGGGGGSSGSLQTDDDNISDFLKALDSRKTLQSFETTKKGESSAAKRTAAQLSKFHSMKESNNALTESMTSSMHLPRSDRSSASSSRQLQNVPSMVNAASISASSSPGKPLSPHTPHTPAIPSRLSENSIIDYHQPGPGPRRQPRNPHTITTEEESAEDAPVSQEGTRAIEIPHSPRITYTSNTRRASSVAEENLGLAGEDDSDMVHRSVSLGVDDREAPSLSALLGLRITSGAAPGSSAGLQPAADMRASGPSSPTAERDEKSPSPGFLSGVPPYRLQRYPSRPTPTYSSRGSFSGPSSRYRGGSVEEGEDEPLVFAMSELERDSRRSLEEGRGSIGGHSAQDSGRKAPFEPRGITKRGW